MSYSEHQSHPLKTLHTCKINMLPLKDFCDFHGRNCGQRQALKKMASVWRVLPYECTPIHIEVWPSISISCKTLLLSLTFIFLICKLGILTSPVLPGVILF
jgi:hypothetical protein